MIRKRNGLERKVQAVFCGFLIVLLGLCALVPSVLTERSVWSSEIVDNLDSPVWATSIALDSNNYPHISYYDSDWPSNDGDLLYAYKDSGGWHVTMVDTSGNVGMGCSLALTPSGDPRISYCTGYPDNGDLKYAYRDGGAWFIGTVDSSGNLGGHTSLVLDSQGYPHISYSNTVNDDLKYAHMDDGGWHTSTVDSTGNVGGYTSLALDSNEFPHIGYTDWDPNYDLKYAYQDDIGWHIEVADAGGANQVGAYVSLALDTNDYPHMSYREGNMAPEYHLRYAYKDAGGWHIEVLDGTIWAGGSGTSIALDSSDSPHISYEDSTNFDLKYAYRDALGWTYETVDTDHVGGRSSLALDSSDCPHISYGDWTNYDVKYAYRDTAPPIIIDVHATPAIQIPGGEVTVFCTITDNMGMGDTRVNITYPDSSSVNVSMSPRGGYEYSDTYSQAGTYTYFIWANDTRGNTATSGLYQFTIAATDYLKITYDTHNEIPDTTISTNITLDCYAGAFNSTHGFITFVDATWNLQNSGGSNASINTASGESVEFFSGWYDGTVTVTVDDGSGHSDSVVFTVDSSAHCLLLYHGWNLIGWSQDYATDAETLGQYISGCTVVCKFNGDSQSYVTHVVGIPYNEFIVTRDSGLFVYTTEAGIWDSTDGIG